MYFFFRQSYFSHSVCVSIYIYTYIPGVGTFLLVNDHYNWIPDMSTDWVFQYVWVGCFSSALITFSVQLALCSQPCEIWKRLFAPKKSKTTLNVDSTSIAIIVQNMPFSYRFISIMNSQVCINSALCKANQLQVPYFVMCNNFS